MSLLNKLKRLSDKIDYYSNVLNEQIEKMNDTTIKNKKAKLTKWNKCKINLNRELNVIDNKLNRFIKDSNNCINQLKFNDINKTFRFGNDENDENDENEINNLNIINTSNQIRRRLFTDDNEESDVDLENDIEEETEEGVPITPPTPIPNTPGSPFTPIQNSEFSLLEGDFNTPVQVERIDIYLKNEFIKNVKNQNDINLKLYNCMLYGTFLSYYNMSIDMMINESEYRQDLENSRNMLDSFLLCLKNNDAYLAGGYINMAINYSTFINSYNTDLDIYVNKRNFKNLYSEIKNIGNLSHYLYDISSPYMESFFKKNGLLSRLVLYIKRIKIDILIVRDDYDLKDVIKNFDLTYCSVYLDPQDLSIKGNIKDMINKSGKLNDDYAKKYLFNKFIQNRLKKYKKRGYKTSIKTNIDVIIQDEKKNKVINNTIIVHKLLFRMYIRYVRIIPIEELLYITSVLDYTKKNLIKSTKKIATILYQDERYYYYILIGLIDSILNEVNQQYRTQVNQNPNINPNFHKFLSMLVSLSDQLKDTAKEKNEEEFLQKPKNTSKIILLLKNYSVTNLLKAIKSSFEISNNSINELQNISKQNKNISFNELLLNSSDSFLSDPKYINTIMTVLKKYYFLQYKEHIFEDYWFTQQKFSTATLINFYKFKDKITEYRSSDIDFRKIMYYDLYEAEEKPYDEVYEDSDNLLFVLEDTKNGFTYTFDTLTTQDLSEFILECTQDVLSAPTLEQIKHDDKWYSQLSSPYNIGVLVSQLYQAYSLYENSNKEIRKFVFSSPQQLEHVSNIKAIQWENSGINIWDEYIDLVSATHCGIGMKVYDKVMYHK